ncbi:hypothetical protein ACP275_09G118200 [Erythranthe tilingii]
MASNFSLRSSFFCTPKAVFQSEDISNFKTNSSFTSKIIVQEQDRHNWKISKIAPPKKFLLTRVPTSRKSSPNWNTPPGAQSSVAESSPDIVKDDDCSLVKLQSSKTEFNRVNCLVRALHESSRSFSLAMQTHEFVRTGPPVAMAWNGVDVHAWHKHIAYQVAAYALLEAAIEVELFLSHNRFNNPSPVHKILSPNTSFLRDKIETQLNARNPKLVQWFRTVELPRFSGYFMPLFKKWSMEYAGSGVAGTIMAITCCAAVGKLDAGRISCSSFSISIEEAIIELMTVAHDLVCIDKLHQLSTEAGFEDHFLSRFGSKVLPSKNVEDIEFWIGLVQTKLSVAFERESVVTKSRHNLSDKFGENSLATLALFAYLGREARLFLLRHNIKDIDEPINDFLSYLECGILFIYPEFSTLSEYQLLMEVIIDEIGWLDFFAAYNCELCQERRRSKTHPIQAEQEIILYAVFTICYDIISGFAHYTSSTQQNLDAELLEFLLQSQSLLSTCLEDYWAAYDRTGRDLPKIGEINGTDSAPSFLKKGQKNSSIMMDSLHRPEELRNRDKHRQISPQTEVASSSKPVERNFLKKYAMKLVAASVDVWMGTQLLFVDTSETVRFIVKKMWGHNVTERERKKMERTLADIATLIPVTILMLLPVSAVGHAAMFAAIKRYIPCLIPSPYSDERINLVKQLKRTKKMEMLRVGVEETVSKGV